MGSDATAGFGPPLRYAAGDGKNASMTADEGTIGKGARC